MLLVLSGLYGFSYYRDDDHCYRLRRVGHSCVPADNCMNSNAYLMASWVSM